MNQQCRVPASKLLEGVAEIGKAIMQRNYIDDVLSLIVSVTVKATASKVCSLLLLDRKNNELILRASQPRTGRYHLRANVPLGEGIAGRVAASGIPMKVLDVRSDPRYLNTEIARFDGLVSLLSAPMSAEGDVIGVVNCYMPEEYDFNDEDVSMLTAVASQAAAVIKNSELRVISEAAQRELLARKTVERAKEIVMEKRGISAKQAFELMRKQSMNSRTSLVKIAESVIVASAFD